MDRISGAYPAGPSASGGIGRSESPEAHAPIRGAEDHARDADLRDQKQRLTKRRVRVLVGVGTTLLVSAAAGIFLGLSSSRRAEQALLESAESSPDPNAVIGREMDRLIDELWLMEDLERMPRPRGAR